MPLVDSGSTEKEILLAILELLQSLTTTLIRQGGGFRALNVYDHGRT